MKLIQIIVILSLISCTTTEMTNETKTVKSDVINTTSNELRYQIRQIIREEIRDAFKK